MAVIISSGFNANKIVKNSSCATTVLSRRGNTKVTFCLKSQGHCKKKLRLHGTNYKNWSFTTGFRRNCGI